MSKERKRPAQRACFGYTTRWQKNLMHFGVITAILLSLWYEGGKNADWLFLGLSVMTEVS